MISQVLDIPLNPMEQSSAQLWLLSEHTPGSTDLDFSWLGHGKNSRSVLVVLLPEIMDSTGKGKIQTEQTGK